MTNSSNSSNEEAIYGCIGLIAATVILVPIIAIINGLVAMYLWNNLLVPVFEVLPVLSWQMALGTSFAISYLTDRSGIRTGKKDNEGDLIDKVGNLIGRIFITPLFYVLIAWIISAYLY